MDLHIQVLQKLGARIVENGNEIQATCGKLKGAEVIFPKSSVGATEQGILAAVLAEGKTVFTGCAREPEITWLCQYLTGMGAKIEILENGSICIEGVKKLHPGSGTIPRTVLLPEPILWQRRPPEERSFWKIRRSMKCMQSWKYIGKWVDNVTG